MFECSLVFFFLCFLVPHYPKETNQILELGWNESEVDTVDLEYSLNVVARVARNEDLDATPVSAFIFYRYKRLKKLFFYRYRT